MARVKLSGLLSNISGSIGGSTFQQCGSGLIIRNKPIQPSGSSKLQNSIRINMSLIQASWKTMTFNEKQLWNKFILYASPTIKRDSSFLLTSYQLFVKWNMFRLCAGLPISKTFIYLPLDANTFSPLITMDGQTDMTTSIAFSSPGLNMWFKYMLSTPRQPNANFSWAGLRYIPIPVAQSTSFDITSFYSQIFGVLPVIGDTLFYAVQFISIVSPLFGSYITGSVVISSI